MADELLSDRELLSQGFIPRFLLAWPKTTQGTRFHQEPTAITEASMMKYERRVEALLSRLLPIREGTTNVLEPRTLRLGDNARKLWIKFHDGFEARLKPDEAYGPLKDFLNKVCQNVIRVAGVLTAFENIEETEITAEILQRAIEIMNFYTWEAARIKSMAETDSLLLDANRLLSWLSENWLPKHGDIIAMRLLCQYAIPKKYRPKAKMEELIKPLVENKWLVELPDKYEIDGRQYQNCYRIRRPI